MIPRIASGGSGFSVSNTRTSPEVAPAVFWGSGIVSTSPWRNNSSVRLAAVTRHAPGHAPANHSYATGGLEVKAILLDGFGGPEVLKLGEASAPAAGPGRVLIRVAATSVNRPDLIQRQG